jgi:hypothetical protein
MQRSFPIEAMEITGKFYEKAKLDFLAHGPGLCPPVEFWMRAGSAVSTFQESKSPSPNNFGAFFQPRRKARHR